MTVFNGFVPPMLQPYDAEYDRKLEFEERRLMDQNQGKNLEQKYDVIERDEIVIDTGRQRDFYLRPRIKIML